MLQDARIYQIFFLSLFLLLGLATRDWTLRPEIIATAIGTCLLTQWIALRWRSMFNNPLATPSEPKLTGNSTWRSQLPHYFSPLITSLGLSILLRVDHWETMVLACVAAIGSKFLIEINQKHIFNPANFGIIAALIFTEDAWVSPGQWGESIWYAALFVLCGGLVLKKVGRWDTTVAFLGMYAMLEALRNLYLGWTWDVWEHRLMSGSLMMFALFMVTDPRTIPNSLIGRLIWTFVIALITFGLRNFWFINTAVFWALFFAAPLTPILDACLKADRFVWVKSTEGSLAESPRSELA